MPNFPQGIYRVSGLKTRVEKLCQAFENGDHLVDLTDQHPNVIANVLKLYLRQLPEPLFTFRLYPDFIRIAKDFPANSSADANNNEAIVEQLKEVISQIPAHFKNSLAELMLHLNRVAANHDVNNMPPSNLGIVFGPTLLRTAEGSASLSSLVDTVHQTRAVELLVEHAPSLFPHQDREVQHEDSSNLKPHQRTRLNNGQLHLPGSSRLPLRPRPSSSGCERLEVSDHSKVRKTLSDVPATCTGSDSGVTSSQAVKQKVVPESAGSRKHAVHAAGAMAPPSTGKQQLMQIHERLSDMIPKRLSGSKEGKGRVVPIRQMSEVGNQSASTIYSSDDKSTVASKLSGSKDASADVSLENLAYSDSSQELEASAGRSSRMSARDQDSAHDSAHDSHSSVETTDDADVAPTSFSSRVTTVSLHDRSLASHSIPSAHGLTFADYSGDESSS
ncbi:hypothetical protein HAZT_HAZT010778 [Hyalella azteca]|uniref:Rho-GAP domain-containing protein n=1 Tax=Hyalella azteca TaxID=294128 RepID=A0A6A0H5T9_HYAAZ|nr:hypothetical protein HAZT_HAZT010778 [Hyalella azteca]